MSKSYNNIIPLLSDEKTLKKSIAKIVTNSLEPGEPKDINGCNVLSRIFTRIYILHAVLQFHQSDSDSGNVLILHFSSY